MNYVSLQLGHSDVKKKKKACHNVERKKERKKISNSFLSINSCSIFCESYAEYYTIFFLFYK